MSFTDTPLSTNFDKSRTVSFLPDWQPQAKETCQRALESPQQSICRIDTLDLEPPPPRKENSDSTFMLPNHHHPSVRPLLNRKKFQVLISKTPTTQTKKDSTKNQNNYKETDKHKQQKKHTHTHARTREHPSVQTKQTHKDKEGGEKKKKNRQ